jgi:hypothetical protein
MQRWGWSMDADTLEGILQQAWCRESSTDPEHWTPENPAWGQCAVTACVAQDYLGGRIVWADATTPDGAKYSHYFNNIEGKEIDLTRRQFAQGTLIPAGIDKAKNFPTTRHYVLSFPATQERYLLLKDRVEGILS